MPVYAANLRTLRSLSPRDGAAPTRSIVAARALESLTDNDEAGSDVTADEEVHHVEGDEISIRCNACGLRLTTADRRVVKGGSHRHTQMNPSGFFFTIVCFSWAAGVVDQGLPSSAWSWFDGYAWTIVSCARCQRHLGWRFSALSGQASDVFLGFIEAHIREDT